VVHQERCCDTTERRRDGGAYQLCPRTSSRPCHLIIEPAEHEVRKSAWKGSGELELKLEEAQRLAQSVRWFKLSAEQRAGRSTVQSESAFTAEAQRSLSRRDTPLRMMQAYVVCRYRGRTDVLAHREQDTIMQHTPADDLAGWHRRAKVCQTGQNLCQL
jgi:hypothetical protein